jgi:hypothetical protein
MKTPDLELNELPQLTKTLNSYGAAVFCMLSFAIITERQDTDQVLFNG